MNPYALIQARLHSTRESLAFHRRMAALSGGREMVHMLSREVAVLESLAADIEIEGYLNQCAA